MEKNVFQEYFDNLKYDRNTFNILKKEYQLERDLDIRDFYLSLSKICTKSCFNQDFRNFTNCYLNCSQQLFKKSDWIHQNINNSMDYVLGLSSQTARQDEKYVKKKKSKNLNEFPNYMYSGSKVPAEQTEKSQEGAFFGRNRSVSQQKKAKSKEKLLVDINKD
jgi:hypothetical protein